MAVTFPINRQKLYQLAEWIISGLVFILGIRYLKQVIVFVLMELYRIFIQRSHISI